LYARSFSKGFARVGRPGMARVPTGAAVPDNKKRPSPILVCRNRQQQQQHGHPSFSTPRLSSPTHKRMGASAPTPRTLVLRPVALTPDPNRCDRRGAPPRGSRTLLENMHSISKSPGTSPEAGAAGCRTCRPGAAAAATAGTSWRHRRGSTTRGTARAPPQQ